MSLLLSALVSSHKQEKSVRGKIVQTKNIQQPVRWRHRSWAYVGSARKSCWGARTLQVPKLGALSALFRHHPTPFLPSYFPFTSSLSSPPFDFDEPLTYILPKICKFVHYKGNASVFLKREEYRVFIKYCVFYLKILWFFWTLVSSAAVLVFYLPGVCTHSDAKGKQRKTRVRNIL